MGEAKRKKKYVDEWCGRMAARFGATLKDDRGIEWSWRRALFREAHNDGQNTPPRNPTGLEVEVAKAWEAGFWPKWAPRVKTRLALPGDG